MSTDAPTSPDLLVACLCADWCYICGGYRAVFDSLRDEFDATAAFVWVDIEDEEATLGNVEVDDFPTFLIARGAAVVHFGPLIARREAALRIVQRALRGELSAIDDVHVQQLAGRLRALQGAKAR
jgi:hypothetical protein